jgi:putative transposase
MSQLLPNQVIMQTEPDPRFYRVLWVEPDSIPAPRYALFDLSGNAGMPEWTSAAELDAALAEGLFVLASVDARAVGTLRPEAELTSGEKAHRDGRYRKIAELVADPGRSILYEELRGPAINRAAATHHTDARVIRRLLQQFWRNGQTPNALLPLYSNCGGKGTRANAGASEGPKRGRPRKQVAGKEEVTGPNIDDRARRLLVMGARRFHEKGGMPLTVAYRETLKTYFPIGYSVDPDGTLVPVIPGENERPTMRQFRYHYEQERETRTALVARKGVRRFLLEDRPVLSSTAHLGAAPGALYEIDSTRADIALLSSLRGNRIIGRPIIYVVIDRFSRMIVGFHICLEGPNWAGIRQALECTFMDKAEFCRRLGREISPEDWRASGFCSAMLGDRGPGEILSRNADFLINNFWIAVHTAAPLRPDWKAVVERAFRLLNEAYSWEPGATHGPRTRGEPDSRLDSVHTLESFTRIFLELVLEYNNHHWLEHYDADPEVRRADVPLIPRELWNWGIENRQGSLRPVPEIEQVRRALMRTVEGTVTRRGIWVSDLKLHYTCPIADAQDWFVVDRGRKRQRVELAIEDRDVSEAYIRIDRGRIVERCELLPRYSQFRGYARDEVLDERAWERALARNGREDKLQDSISHLHRRDLITASAIAARAEAIADTGERPKIGSREDRREELVRTRSDGLATTRAPAPASSPSQEDAVPAASELDLLRSVGRTHESSRCAARVPPWDMDRCRVPGPGARRLSRESADRGAPADS